MDTLWDIIAGTVDTAVNQATAFYIGAAAGGILVAVLMACLAKARRSDFELATELRTTMLDDSGLGMGETPMPPPGVAYSYRNGERALP